jgi:DNA-binding NarL/FixJ family response regulator
MTDERINLVVLSPDPNLAGVLAAAVSQDPTFEVLGTVPEPDDLDGMVQKWTPTVAIISLALPGSLDALASIDPRTATLALDEVEDPEAMLAALESGADGYAVLEEGLDKLIDAIRAVASGTAWVPPTLLGHLLRHVVQRRRAERQALESLEQLTPREREIFELAARGYRHVEVAEELYISAGTARTHLQRGFSKLDVHSRSELVALAARCGLEVGTVE